MTTAAWVAVAATALLLVTLCLDFRRSARKPDEQAPDPIPETWGQSSDDDTWTQDATTLRHSALQNVRDTAAKWGATITALLGVFGLVVFAKGPSALTDIPGSAAYVVLGFVVPAVLMAGGSIYIAALAAQGTPTHFAQLNGWTLKEYSAKQTPRVVSQLRQSRYLTLAAATFILGAVAVGWLATLHTRGQAPTVFVIFGDGTTACGKVETGGGALLVADGNRSVSLTNVKQIVSSSVCP